MLESHPFKDKFITLSISIPVTETVNLRLLLSIPVIVVKDLKNKIASFHFLIFPLPTRLQKQRTIVKKTIIM